MIVSALSQNSCVLVGSVLRKTICTLLQQKAFSHYHADSAADHLTHSHPISPLITWEALECIYPRYPDFTDLDISDSDR
jgi:hypothetical protein